MNARIIPTRPIPPNNFARNTTPCRSRSLPETFHQPAAIAKPSPEPTKSISRTGSSLTIFSSTPSTSKMVCAVCCRTKISKQIDSQLCSTNRSRETFLPKFRGCPNKPVNTAAVCKKAQRCTHNHCPPSNLSLAIIAVLSAIRKFHRFSPNGLDDRSRMGVEDCLHSAPGFFQDLLDRIERTGQVVRQSHLRLD